MPTIEESFQWSVFSLKTESLRPPRGQTSQLRVATLWSRTLGQGSASQRTLKGFYTACRTTKKSVQPFQGSAARWPETQGALPVLATLGCDVYPLRGTAKELDSDAGTGSPRIQKFAQADHKSRISSTEARRHGEEASGVASAPLADIVNLFSVLPPHSWRRDGGSNLRRFHGRGHLDPVSSVRFRLI